MAFLFFLFFLVPLTGIMIFVWWKTNNKVFGKVIGYFWLSVIGLIILSLVVEKLTAKKILKKKDYYGQYIIDRDFFPGKQADWQYETFRFKINNDKIYFYVEL